MRRDTSDDEDFDKGVGSIESAKRAVKRMLQDSDLAEERNEELEELLDQLEEQESKIQAQERTIESREEELSETRSQLSAYEEKFDEIREPPLMYGHVLRIQDDDLQENEVSVAHNNQVLKVTTGMVEKSDLRQGQHVWLHPKSYSIIGASSKFEEGVVGSIENIIGDKLVITIGDGMQKKIIDWDQEFGDEVKIGYEVSLLPPTYQLLEVRPSSDVRELFLGEKPGVTYDEIGGLDGTIERLRDVVELPYNEPELFEEAQLTAPQGVMLYGPPGCGKTMLAKALATENDMTFFNVSVADIMSKWVGESENMIKALFRKARETSPAIIFFDEFDALGTTRGQQDSAGVHKNLIAQILGELDGIQELHDVFVLGATNRPDMIDPALLRPGRFDEVVEISRPNREGGKQILEIYLNEELPIDSDIIDEQGSREAAVNHLQEKTLDAIYGEEQWVEFEAEEQAQETLKAIKRKDVVSGALIESIVRTAKKNYVKRAMQHSKGSEERKREGIEVDDLLEAVEEESKEHALVESSTYALRQRERDRFRDEGVEVR